MFGLGAKLAAKTFGFKGVSMALVATAVLFFAQGAYVANEFHDSKGAAALREWTGAREIAHKKTVKIIERVVYRQAQINADTPTTEEVNNNVKDNPDCALEYGAERLLDLSATGSANPATPSYATVPRPADDPDVREPTRRPSAGGHDPASPADRVLLNDRGAVPPRE